MEKYYLNVSDDRFITLKPYLHKLKKIYHFYNKNITFTNVLNNDALCQSVLIVDDITVQQYLIGLSVSSEALKGSLQDGVFKLDGITVLDIRETEFYRALGISDHLKELRLHEEKMVFLLSQVLVQTASIYDDLIKAFFEGKRKQFSEDLKQYEAISHQQEGMDKVSQVIACAIDLAIIKSAEIPATYFKKAISLNNTFQNRVAFASYLVIKEDEEIGIPFISALLNNLDALQKDRLYYEFLYALCLLYVVGKTPQKATPLLKEIYEVDHPYIIITVKAYELQGDIYRDMLAFESAIEAYQNVLRLYGVLAEKHPYGDDYVRMFEHVYQKRQNIEMRSIESWR